MLASVCESLNHELHWCNLENLDFAKHFENFRLPKWFPKHFLKSKIFAELMSRHLLVLIDQMLFHVPIVQLYQSRSVKMTKDLNIGSNSANGKLRKPNFLWGTI